MNLIKWVDIYTRPIDIPILDNPDIKFIWANILGLEKEQILQLVDDRNFRISAEKKPKGGYCIHLTELTVNGESVTEVEGLVDKLDDVVKGFEFFLNGNLQDLKNLFSWKPDSDFIVSYKKINQLPPINLKEIDSENALFIEKVDLECDEQMRILEDLIKEDTISSSSSLEKNYSPSFWDFSTHGGINNKIVCKQCGEKGFVHTKSVTKKAGISGGKATAAFLTGGVSLLGFGLSRKEKVTEAYCGNCKSEWYF